MSSHMRTCILPLASALLAVALASSQALAIGPEPFGMARGSILKRLPAGRDELTFRGENTWRSFTVNLSREEIDQTKIFQIGLRNTVSLLPERSSLSVVINGHALPPIPVQSPNVVSTMPIAVPAGALVAGPNTVEIETTLTHRVDCSVAATYELWAQLDPADTGFLVPEIENAPIHSIDDVAGEAAAADGTTPIRLRMSDVTDTAAITRAGRFIDAVTARAGLARPVVEVGAGPGSGPGFDVLLTTAFATDATKDLRVVGRDDGVAFLRDDANRLTLSVSGSDAADLDAKVAAFAAKEPKARVSNAGEIAIEGETRISFAEAGLPPQESAGRRFAAKFGLILPSDFYAANGEKARVLVDGSYANNLEPGSALALRVNGTLVSTLDLRPGRGGVLRHEPFELPLRYFHPGPNDVALEGVMTTPGDRQCAPTSASAPVRLSLADSSEIEFPAFAHLASTPQIPGALPAARSDGKRVELYLPQADASSIGSGLTVLANVASNMRRDVAPVVHLGGPAANDRPGIVVGPWTSLPASLSASLGTHLISAPINVQPESVPTEDRNVAVPGNVAASQTSFSLFDIDFRSMDVDVWVDGLKRLATESGALDVRAWLDKADQVLQTRGYFFKSGKAGETVPFTARTLVVAAADPRVRGHEVAGFDVPGFVADPAQWLVITAADEGVLKTGLDRMISDGHWRDLQGEVVSLDIDKDTFVSVQPSRVLYVKPDHIAIGDIRPILGGMVSSNIELSLAVFVLLMSVLGVSTHVVLRRSGARSGSRGRGSAR